MDPSPGDQAGTRELQNDTPVRRSTLIVHRRVTISIEEKQRGSPTNRDAEKSATDQLQEQIDALVRGEVPQGSRSLRDLTRKPGPEIRKNGSNKKPG